MKNILKVPVSKVSKGTKVKKPGLFVNGGHFPGSWFLIRIRIQYSQMSADPDPDSKHCFFDGFLALRVQFTVLEAWKHGTHRTCRTYKKIDLYQKKSIFDFINMEWGKPLCIVDQPNWK